MYVLHHSIDTAAMIIRLALEERGLPYRIVPAKITSEAYLMLNPAGRIPVLETPEGVLFETGAILLWLADRHDPPLAATRRIDQLKWLFFLSNTAHADLRLTFYPDRSALPEDRDPFIARVAGRMRDHFRLLDAAVQGYPQSYGPRSVLVPYLCTLMRWSVLYPRHLVQWFDIAAYPALADLAAKAEATPHVQSVMAAEGIDARPFTLPKMPRGLA